MRLSSQFESYCFLENVREKWKKGRKKYHLLNKIYRALLEEENLNKDTQLIRSDYVLDRLRRKRMLLVLDNVDDQEQLDFLIDRHLFGPGSRIIITTRDVQLLNNLADNTYKVEGLNFDEALELFHFHASKRSSLTRDPCTNLSRRAVNCAAGNPLALKVLGSHFGNKNKEKWERATAAIEGICLDVSDIRELHLSPFVFEKMDNLRLLKIFYSKVTKKRKVCFDEDLQTLPDNLKYLHWEEYPLKSLPTNFTAENLVELCMPHSQLEKLWSGVQCLENLKKIDLSYSKRLIEIPDLSRARKLETIYLEECESLCQVPTYFENLDQLITLFLVGCSSLSEFPQVPKNLRCLVLCRTAITRVPPSIECLSYLEILCLRYCTRLESLPNISTPKRLKAIELEGTVFEKDLPPWIDDVMQQHQDTALQEYFNPFRREWEANNFSSLQSSIESERTFSCFLGKAHIMVYWDNFGRGHEFGLDS
ncbi:hypothetical protein UlMin_010714 [Ulmus minor]